MGSNVFTLPVFTRESAVSAESADTHRTPAPAGMGTALLVPSFRRRSATTRPSANPPGEHWAAAARRRAALRLVESQSSRVSTAPAGAPPLRVTQLLEAGQLPGASGRLRISGRLADVCAELDRLSMAEARRHTRRA